MHNLYQTFKQVFKKKNKNLVSKLLLNYFKDLTSIFIIVYWILQGLKVYGLLFSLSLFKLFQSPEYSLHHCIKAPT